MPKKIESKPIQDLKLPKWMPSYHGYFVADRETGVTICDIKAESYQEGIERSRLIAAAPDLLEACKALRHFITHESDAMYPKHLIFIASSAINAAEEKP